MVRRPVIRAAAPHSAYEPRLGPSRRGSVLEWFCSTAPRHRRLNMRVVGFAVGANEPCSYRVTTHPLGSQLLREQSETFPVVPVYVCRLLGLCSSESAGGVE